MGQGLNSAFELDNDYVGRAMEGAAGAGQAYGQMQQKQFEPEKTTGGGIQAGLGGAASGAAIGATMGNTFAPGIGAVLGAGAGAAAYYLS